MHASGVDLMLRAGDLPESGVIARKLAEIKFGVYAAQKYLQIAGSPSTPQDLLRHRCLIHKPPPFNKPWTKWEFERNAARAPVPVPSPIAPHAPEALIAAPGPRRGPTRRGLFD